MCSLLIILLLWVSPSTSEKCYDVEKVSSWNRGYKGLLTVQAEEKTTAWSVGICFTDGIYNFEAWKGNVVNDNNNNCFNITNKCYNGILYPCQCLAFDYIARHAIEVSLNVTEVSFNGQSLPQCSAPLQCEIISTDSTVDDAGDDQKWESFKIKYNKTYSDSATETYRRTIWFSRSQLIENHNKKYEAGSVSFKLGENTFMDLTTEEHSSQYKGYRQPESNDTIPVADLSYQELSALPTSVNWVDAGWVTNVKNQGWCGSCWAFSAVGAIEGQHFNATRSNISLSTQQLVDCDNATHGCNGGWPYKAFQYVIANNGIDSESVYPYTATDGICNYTTPPAARISTYRHIQNGSEDDLQKAVANVGPVSVAIDASDWKFQSYDSGVYDPDDCSTTQLDHAVLAVGYGTDSDSGKDYWLVKNSWGTKWGISAVPGEERGYIKMVRNDNNKCGIATAATFPLN